jgi:hypothetical protein
MLYADRFELHPLSEASLDGRQVGDDTRVGFGQRLEFAYRAGEKG